MANAETSRPHDRIFNFSAGPAVLPVPVLEEVRDEMLNLPGAGHSLMEMSHRAKQFVDILHDAQDRMRQLQNISDDYEVLFLQGGAALQFSMIPANLMRGTGKPASYLVTGTWGKKALKEATKEGEATAVFDAADSNYNCVPGSDDYALAPNSAYLYYCSNETIQGVQFGDEPNCPDEVPLVCDVSSDF
ncbi:MAG: aminotransferase class V-fold PLP-dependent enzyme, partial [Planctomycetota bacterium]